MWCLKKSGGLMPSTDMVRSLWQISIQVFYWHFWCNTVHYQLPFLINDPLRHFNKLFRVVVTILWTCMHTGLVNVHSSPDNYNCRQVYHIYSQNQEYKKTALYVHYNGKTKWYINKTLICFKFTKLINKQYNYALSITDPLKMSSRAK